MRSATGFSSLVGNHGKMPVRHSLKLANPAPIPLRRGLGFRTITAPSSLGASGQIYRADAAARLVGYDFIAVALVSVTLAVMHGIEDFIAITSAFAQSLLLNLPVISSSKGTSTSGQFIQRFYCFKSTFTGPAIHAGL
jgi:hypothetical protein